MAFVQARTYKGNPKAEVSSQILLGTMYAGSISGLGHDYKMKNLISQSALPRDRHFELMLKATRTELLSEEIKKKADSRLFEKYYAPSGLLSSLRKQGCGQSQSVTVGYRYFNLGLTRWNDNLYLSPSIGVSTPKVSASIAQGMCEPSTGFFVNATLATPINNGRVNSMTWHPGQAASFERILSTPNAGTSAGLTFKIWSSGR